jgi:orotate phosphoribosyltransferase
MQAIEELEGTGAKVVAAICIVDRLEGARERMAHRFEYRPIFTIPDFGVDPGS